MALETAITEFMHLISVAPIAAVISFGIAAIARFKLKSVYMALLTFVVSFGVLLVVI